MYALLLVEIVHLLFHSFGMFVHFLSWQAYVVKFWMQLLGAGSPKRTVTYSNGPWIQGLDMGILSKKIREASTHLQSTRVVLNRSVFTCI